MKQEQEDIYSKNSRHSIVEIFMIFFIIYILYYWILNVIHMYCILIPELNFHLHIYAQEAGLPNMLNPMTHAVDLSA